MGELGLGWGSLIRIFNSVVASLLSYVGQVVILPPNFHQSMALAISSVFFLPHNRSPPWVMQNLRAFPYALRTSSGSTKQPLPGSAINLIISER